MQKLLSLPPNLIHCFHELEEVNHNEWFCTSDPIGSKLGSGGGTTWLLQACHQAFAPQESFNDWIGREKRILLHAGGQSRRLPSYGPSGKILTPIPIFSWERGQRLGQNLLSLQLPTGILGFHASETLSGRIGRFIQDSPFPNGHRHLDFK